MTLKWTGSKRWIVPVLQPIDEIYEPFAGAGVVSFSRSTTCHLNDSVEPLIETFRQLKVNKQKFVKDIQARVDQIKNAPNSSSEYYLLRDQFNAGGMTDPVLFVALLYTGFNGLFRVGPKGLNVPYGGDNRKFNADGLLSIPVEKIQSLTNVNWEQIQLPNDTCTIYVDPPYATAFTSYTRAGWVQDDNVALFSWLASVSNPVLISCLCTDDNKKLLKMLGFDFIIFPKNYSNGQGSVKKAEILAFNDKSLPSINFREVKWTI